jgi:hypothetical protein
MKRAPTVGLVAVFAFAAGCGDSGPSGNGLFGAPSRGSVGLRFTDTASSNVAPSHIPSNQVTVIFNDPTLDPVVALYVAGWVNKGGGSYTKSWDMIIDIVGPPIEGTVYHLESGQLVNPGDAVIDFMDAAGDWTASAGTITVTSVVGERVRFEIDATMVPHNAGTPPPVPSMGMFSMSGFVIINNIYAVCDCIG